MKALYVVAGLLLAVAAAVWLWPKKGKAGVSQLGAPKAPQGFATAEQILSGLQEVVGGVGQLFAKRPATGTQLPPPERTDFI